RLHERYEERPAFEEDFTQPPEGEVEGRVTRTEGKESAHCRGVVQTRAALHQNIAHDDAEPADLDHDRFRGKVPSGSFGHHLVHGLRSLRCASSALLGRPGIRKSIRYDCHPSDYRQFARTFVGCRAQPFWVRAVSFSERDWR